MTPAHNKNLIRAQAFEEAAVEAEKERLIFLTHESLADPAGMEKMLAVRKQMRREIAAALRAWAEALNDTGRDAGVVAKPVPQVLYCPAGHQHVDEGEWATKPHKTHLCQRITESDGATPDYKTCGLEWRPALFPTVGVRELPGDVSA